MRFTKTSFDDVASFIAKRSSTAQVRQLAKAYGLGVVSGSIYVNLNGTPTLLADALAGQTTSSGQTTTANIGTKNGATVSVVEYGNPIIHKTVFTLTALPLTLADATVGAGVKIYDFPTGSITILAAQGTIAETTTSAILTTLNGGVNLSVGVGTTTQANGTLATTEQDILTAFTAVSSATINVAAASASKVRTAAAATFDGTGTNIKAFFNVGVPLNTDIDADATTTYTGTITISWMFNS